ncbi:MAG: hypothetical protein ACLPN6_04540 [Streptosporangiaceae bacterium]|jgi:urate oxidase
MDIVLSADQYGKAETRLVRICRDAPEHQIRDLNVSTALRGDFAVRDPEGNRWSFGTYPGEPRAG